MLPSINTYDYQISNALFNNEDESTISFKDRNDNFQDNGILATYTICLMDEHCAGLYKRDEWIYNDRHFGNNGWSLGLSKYTLKLEGYQVAVKNKSNPNQKAMQFCGQILKFFLFIGSVHQHNYSVDQSK